MAVNSADEQGKPGNKGFAGLSKLVSKVDIPAAPAPLPAPARANPQPTPSPTPTSASMPTKAPEARPAAPYNPPVGKQGRGTAWGWLVGIGGFIAFMALSSQNGANRSSTGSAPTSAPTYSAPTAPSGASNKSTNVLDQFDAPSAPLVEAMPPPGTNLVLSGAQVRYCLAEHIRMDAARTAVDNYSDHDVDLFNSMVANFNSRCSSYRYRDRDMSSAKNDVEAHRSELQFQGVSRLR